MRRSVAITASIMRVLILSAALFACASAAPSGAVIAPVPVPVAVPTVNPGDLQAALIDAKVQTEDYLRSIADKQREAVEKVVVDHNEKAIEGLDQVKERSLEAFWANEDKKWQALDAAQTAQAQLDGHLASSDSKIVVYSSPIVAPAPQYLYTPGFVAAGVNFPEAKKEEAKSEKQEEAKSDSVQVESASLKTGENQEAAAEKPAQEGEKVEPSKYIVGQTPLLPTLPIVPTLKLVPQPWGPVAYVQTGLKTIAAVPYPGHVLAPTVFKTVW